MCNEAYGYHVERLIVRSLRWAVSVMRTAVFAVLVLVSTTAGSAMAAGQIDPQNYATDVNVQVLPIAEIQVIGSPLLYLRIPPPGSTLPVSGVNFKVTGNANATVTAEPDSFVTIPTDIYPAGEHMGRAVLNGNPVGYRLRIDFPVAGVPGSPTQNAALPGYEPGPTAPLSVNLGLTSGMRNGRLHMEASPAWTPSGGLPLPGIYAGTVVLTVSAF